MATRYVDAVFAATHNSYSPGRGALRRQLDGGVRCLELDFNLADGRYELGHLHPGDAVHEGDGNPDDLALASWLGVIAAWSAGRAGHAPITLVLDVKDDLTEPDSFAQGNPAALNDVLLRAFGERLLTPVELGSPAAPWPDLDAMRGRVVVVLSGNQATRRGYRLDGGRSPAVAIDGAGAIIEVHASRRGELWYWSGRHEHGRVRWQRHGRIGEGRAPTVALTDDGTVIAVHGGGTFDVSYRIGRLDGSGEIAWGEERRAGATGAAGDPAPTLGVLDGGRLRVTYESGYGRRAATGALATRDGAPAIAWDAESEPATGQDAQRHRNHAERGGRIVSVVAVPRPGGDGERLVYGTERVVSAPVRYEQLAFVEAQWGVIGGRETVDDEQRFVAVSAGSAGPDAWAREWGERDRLVRAWSFGADDVDTRAQPNFPATDAPEAAWYSRYLKARGAVRDSPITRGS